MFVYKLKPYCVALDVLLIIPMYVAAGYYLIMSQINTFVFCCQSHNMVRPPSNSMVVVDSLISVKIISLFY